jgi:hypothetical protein
MDDISRLATDFKEFCWKHRTKIGVGAICIAGGAALYYYYGGDDNQSTSSQVTRAVSVPNGSKDKLKDSKKEPEVESERTRMLLAVNELYGFSLVYFLPNIRSRVRTLVDVSHAIRKLKDLKNDTSEEARDLKVTMWDEINLSAFSSLVATVYSLAAVSILLRVQMHILVRDASRMGDQEQPEEDIFYELMEGSYRHLFGAGLEALTDRVKCVVSAKLREGDWNVESRMSVEFEELNELLSLMRSGMEGDGEGLHSVLETLFALPHTLTQTLTAEGLEVAGLNVKPGGDDGDSILEHTENEDALATRGEAEAEGAEGEESKRAVEKEEEKEGVAVAGVEAQEGGIREKPPTGVLKGLLEQVRRTSICCCCCC